MRQTGMFLTGFWNDEGAAVGAQYSILLVLIALGISAAVVFLGAEIADAIDRAVQCIQDGPACVVAVP